jgi:hypothetical protein
VAVAQLQTGLVEVQSQIGLVEVQSQIGPAAARLQIGPAVARLQTGLAAAQWQIGPVVARSPAGHRPLPLLALRRSLRGTGLRLAPPRPEGTLVVSRWEALPDAVPRVAAFMAGVAVAAFMAAAVRPARVEEVASAVAADGIVEGAIDADIRHPAFGSAPLRLGDGGLYRVGDGSSICRGDSPS